MVGIDIKRFIKRLKLSVQVKEKFLSSFLKHGEIVEESTSIAIGNGSCDFF